MHVDAGSGPASFPCVLACRKAQGHGPGRAHRSSQWVTEEQRCGEHQQGRKWGLSSVAALAQGSTGHWKRAKAEASLTESLCISYPPHPLDSASCPFPPQPFSQFLLIRIRWVLQTECLCPPQSPLKFICGSPNPQYSYIWRWGL